ncbi:TonB-dependent receptor [Chitinophaga nivalis]|uniref:Carboxypeptidase regulatory-like domain-containing protein n=1 Tax=Chitinophaga nivalis TaxID=2991709 RepID=A0ABT3IH01_9BACT|nr:carboxypeptidase regulatory-like domain-containing protein [Chitinophaga nivalis]MCW3467085.1 carboxypeptidase regulatory-like domain-containing protein [Chitinophaga nivalis]MCW3483224.1 carboxypeptidase regulatory-like domain-containing protein [Chitinophaga nivalis]
MYQPNRTKVLLCLLTTCFFTFLHTYAQVTTATLSGVVKNEEGQPLPGATIKVLYEDAGINKGLVTKSDGSFLVPNLRVGGPYTVTVSFTGFAVKTATNIYLNLGQNTALDLRLSASVGKLNEVVVSGRSTIFNDQRTGASTNIGASQIRQLPTISRSVDDYLRLAPSASPTYNGISFAGRNGQYNNFSLDGAVFNNPFGLDAPAPGGQTNSQPISLDAIDQVQINVAPYDVTQSGFTGAGVNTVTKSGSNKFTGTVYAFFRNDALSGNKIDGQKIPVPTLEHFQAGFSLGGAIKKNKLYYFINFESEQRKDEASAYVAANAGNKGDVTTSRVLEDDLLAVSAVLSKRYGYETGPYQDYNLKRSNYKWLAKLDWVINSKHALSFTYNGLQGSQDKGAHPNAINRRGPDAITLQFRNAGYEMVNQLHSFGLELKSNFSDTYANKFRAVYTSFRDRRNPFSEPFPVLNITKFNVPYIVAGYEPFSINNRLNQDALQLTNNFNIILPKHTITVGASYEQFKFGNSFNLTGFGYTIFSGIDINTFLTTAAAGGYDANVTYARNRAAANQWTWYYLTVGQLSAYVQDEWNAANNLKITYGVRADKALYFPSKASYNSPNVNPDGTLSGTYLTGTPTVPNKDNLVLYDEAGNRVKNGPGEAIDNTRMPSGKILISPRLGFNWDINGDKKVQLRGGTGIFTGRFPFVWVGNAIGNPFTGYYNVTAHDFKWPQIWRSNIGLDYRLPVGTILTADVAYSKDLNAMMVRDYGLGTPNGRLNSGTGDTRSVYLPGDKGNTGTYVFTNANVGYSFNTSLQAQQNFRKGYFLTFGYNYLVAKDASSISAEISGDAFDRNPVLGNANKAVESASLYGNTHRFTLAGIKKFEYGKGKYATTISFFGSWTSGNRFSYVYGGDINNDGSPSNDLLYVPTRSEVGNMNFAAYTDAAGRLQDAAAQGAALEAFIDQDKYLRQHRGQYTGKYEGTTPWFSQLDLRILQDFNFRTKEHVRTLQLSIDVVNLGNLLNSSWGLRKYASPTGYYQPLTYTGKDAGGKAVYQFDPSQTSTFITSPDLPSRWQLQVGLRYTF